MMRDKWRRKLPKLVMLMFGVVMVQEGQAQERLPTPEIAGFEAVDVAEGVAYVMRAEVAGTGVYVGLSLLCEGPGEVEAVAYFGSFPGSRQPVQLAVKDAAGQIERFGPVVRGRSGGWIS